MNIHSETSTTVTQTDRNMHTVVLREEQLQTREILSSDIVVEADIWCLENLWFDDLCAE